MSRSGEPDSVLSNLIQTGHRSRQCSALAPTGRFQRSRVSNCLRSAAAKSFTWFGLFGVRTLATASNHLEFLGGPLLTRCRERLLGSGLLTFRRTRFGARRTRSSHAVRSRAAVEAVRGFPLHGSSARRRPPARQCRASGRAPRRPRGRGPSVHDDVDPPLTRSHDQRQHPELRLVTVARDDQARARRRDQLLELRSGRPPAVWARAAARAVRPPRRGRRRPRYASDLHPALAITSSVRARTPTESARLPVLRADRVEALPGHLPAALLQLRDVPVDHGLCVARRPAASSRVLRMAPSRLLSSARSHRDRRAPGRGARVCPRLGARLRRTAACDDDRDQQQERDPHLSSRDIRRSLSVRPPVWHVGQ